MTGASFDGEGSLPPLASTSGSRSGGGLAGDVVSFGVCRDGVGSWEEESSVGEEILDSEGPSSPPSFVFLGRGTGGGLICIRLSANIAFFSSMVLGGEAFFSRGSGRLSSDVVPVPVFCLTTAG